MNKITVSQFCKFINEFDDGLYPHQRVGQAFLNKFFPKVTDPEVFYGTNHFAVRSLILVKYVGDE